MIGLRKHTRYIEFPKHRHDYMELIYVLSGDITHELNDKVATIGKGQILILNQNIDHSIKYTKSDDIALNFMIHPNYLFKIIQNLA